MRLSKNLSAITPDVAGRFADAIRSAGGRVKLVLYPGMGHGFFNQDRFDETCRGAVGHFRRVFGWTDPEGA